MGDRSAERGGFTIPVAQQAAATSRGRVAQRIADAPWFYLLLAVIGLGIGRSLHPDPRGFGTHEALGLPPCTFFTVTSVPCPACGMTTAVSYAAHGQFLRSFFTQPVGFLVGFGLWVSVPLLAFAWWRGWSVNRLLPAEPRHRLGWGIVILPVMGAAWLYKIAIVLILS